MRKKDLQGRPNLTFPSHCVFVVHALIQRTTGTKKRPSRPTQQDKALLPYCVDLLGRLPCRYALHQFKFAIKLCTESLLYTPCTRTWTCLKRTASAFSSPRTSFQLRVSLSSYMSKHQLETWRREGLMWTGWWGRKAHRVALASLTRDFTHC